MSVSFAGVNLPTPTPEVSDWVRRNLSLSDVLEFSRLHWPTRGLTHLSFPGTAPDRPAQLGRLWWPRGASRFAVGHFLATDTELATIRQSVYTGTNKLLPAPLEMTSVLSGGNTLAPPAMFMLPPRPLAQIPGSNGLWLLTLVDDRYFWWFKSTNVLSVTEGVTTWADLYAAIGTALGVTITHDTVAAAYLKPARSLASLYEYTPLVLDAVAYNCGQRIVRRTDGTVHALNAVSSKTILGNNLSPGLTWPKIAGGKFSLDALVSPNDAPPMLPYGVQVAFPRADDGALTGGRLSQAVTLAELNLFDIPGTTLRHEGYKLFHDQAVAAYNTATATYDNQTELTALVKQIATDFYRHQLAPYDIHLAGIFPWITEGLSDSVEWIHSGDDGLEPGQGLVSTRVQRPPFNDLTLELLHAGTAGSSTGGGGNDDDGGGGPPATSLIVQESDGAPRSDPCQIFNVNQDHYLTWTAGAYGSGELGWNGHVIYHTPEGFKGPKRVMEFVDGAGITIAIEELADRTRVGIATTAASTPLLVTELDGSPYTEACNVFGVNQDTYLTWTASAAHVGYISWLGFTLQYSGTVVGPHKRLEVVNLGGLSVAVAEDVPNDKNILYLQVLNYSTMAGDRKDFYYFRDLSQSRYHIGGISTGAAKGLQTLSGHTLYAMPLPTPRGGTLDRIGVHVTTAAAAGNRARLGIYSATSDTNLYPGNLELDAGYIAVDATGVVAATINFACSGGKLYWLVVICETSTEMATIAPGAGYPLLGVKATDFQENDAIGWKAAHGSFPAAMPNPFTAGGSVMINDLIQPTVAIGVRFSA